MGHIKPNANAMKRLTAICLMILLTGACSRPETEIPEYRLNATPLPLSDHTINTYERLFLNESEGYILMAESFGTDAVKKIFYKNDSTVSVLRRGRGPNEYTDSKICNIEANGDFYIMSVTQGKIDKHAKDGSPIRHVDIETFFASAIELGDQYISYGDFSVSDNTMYTLSDASGRTICRFGAYPDDGVPADFAYKAMAYQGRLVANDARSRFAFLTIFGEVLDIYEIQNDSIPSKIASYRNGLPTYQPKEGVIGVKYDEFHFAYLDAYASERFIYALYSGKKPVDRTPQALSDAQEGNVIRLYDWDGNLRANLITDVELLCLCVSADDSFIIALYEDEGVFRLCTFDIGEVIRQITAEPNNPQLPT